MSSPSFCRGKRLSPSPEGSVRPTSGRPGAPGRCTTSRSTPPTPTTSPPPPAPGPSPTTDAPGTRAPPAGATPKPNNSQRLRAIPVDWFLMVESTTMTSLNSTRSMAWQSRKPGGKEEELRSMRADRLSSHTHGVQPDPNLPTGNSATGPTTMIRDKSTRSNYATFGRWVKLARYPNESHIPTDNWPFENNPRSQ